MSEEDNCRQALEQYTQTLLAFPNVVGVGIGEEIKDEKPTGRCAVKVYVKRKVTIEHLNQHEVLPDTLQLVSDNSTTAVPIDVEEQDNLELQ